MSNKNRINMTSRPSEPSAVGPDQRDVIGDVQVEGTTYRIRRSGLNAREVVRSSDGRCVGRLRGSPSSMWLIEADEGDEALLHTIVERAIQDGLLIDLPSD